VVTSITDAEAPLAETLVDMPALGAADPASDEPTALLSAVSTPLLGPVLVTAAVSGRSPGVRVKVDEAAVVVRGMPGFAVAMVVAGEAAVWPR